MKKIVILGNSAAGVKAAENIRTFDAEAKITFLTTENQLPFYRSRTVNFLGGFLAMEKVFCHDRDFYSQRQMDVILDKKVSRINFRRCHVAFEDKDRLDYDVLILTDTLQTRLPDIKGMHRTGIFSLRRLGEVLELSKLIPVCDTVIVQSTTPLGLQLVCALRQRNKEVLWVSPESRILSAFWDEESSAVIQKNLEDWGVRIVLQNEVAELLGDQDFKAARLKNGKVIAAQAVCFPDAGADFKLFRDTELLFDDRIAVNDTFQTNISNVYVMDDLARHPKGNCPIWDSEIEKFLDAQAQMVASSVAGQGLVAEYPPASGFSANIHKHSLTTLGDTTLSPETRFLKIEREEGKSYLKAFVRKNIVVGAVSLNMNSELQRLAKMIRERSDVAQDRSFRWEDLCGAADASAENQEPVAAWNVPEINLPLENGQAG